MKTESILTAASIVTLFLVSALFGAAGNSSAMGLSIVTGCLGLAFANIDKFKKISGAGFSAEMKEQIEAVIDKETDYGDDIDPEHKETYEVFGEERRIVIALKSREFSMRTANGIAKETRVPTKTVEDTLTHLQKNGLAIALKGKGGAKVWRLTRIGKTTYSDLPGAD